MGRILISLFVPSIDDSYELFIPDQIPLGEWIPIMINGIQELTMNRYKSSGDELLYMEGIGLLKDLNMTASQYGLQNGDSLMLF